MDPITDDIWLGAIGAANDHELLEKTGITYMVSLGCVPDVMPKCIKEHLKIDVEDVPSAELTPHFKTACEFIEKALNEKQKVLVHCNMGISRSASIVVAYFIKAKAMLMSEARDFVKSKRNQIDPNIGFLMQLEEWDEEINNREPEQE